MSLVPLRMSRMSHFHPFDVQQDPVFTGKVVNLLSQTIFSFTPSFVSYVSAECSSRNQDFFFLLGANQ